MSSSQRSITLMSAALLLLFSLACRQEEEAPAPVPVAPPVEVTEDYEDSRCTRQKARPVKTVIIMEALPTVEEQVTPDPVCVSKKRGERVVWVAAGDADLQVVFETEGPFADAKGKPVKSYKIPKGGATVSGPIRKDVHPVPNAYFKYTVEVQGGQDIDPRVIVDP